MNYIIWIVVGLVTMLFSFLERFIVGKFIRPIPGAATKFGKSWNRTTDRFLILRALNLFFYFVGMAATAVGITIAISNINKSEPTQPPAIYQPIPDETLDSSQVLYLVNQERARQGLEKLVSDPRLVAVAEARAKDMVDEQYYAHINSEGKYFHDLYPAFGFKSEYSCENLDTEFTTDESKYVNDWLVSTKGHKECMLNRKTTAAGYAAVLFGETSNGKIYLVVGIHSTPLKSLD